jgi:hypothetical protein
MGNEIGFLDVIDTFPAFLVWVGTFDLERKVLEIYLALLNSLIGEK